MCDTHVTKQHNEDLQHRFHAHMGLTYTLLLVSFMQLKPLYPEHIYTH